MKLITTIFLLFLFTITNAQNKVTLKNEDVKLTSVTYTVKSISELKTINWNDVKELFTSNNADDDIKLCVALQLPESKNKIKTSYTVAGKIKDLDDLIFKSKKGVQSIIRLTNKLKKN